MLDLIELQGRGNQPRAHGSMAGRVMEAIDNGHGLEVFRPNDVLYPRDWIEVDTAVSRVNRMRLVGNADLINAGLVMRLENAMGTTVVEYGVAGDLTNAQTDMSAETAPEEDRLGIGTGKVAVPITHKGFRYNARALASSRRNNHPLDTDTAEVATQRVNEQLENLLFNGSLIQETDAFVYGYRTHPNRITSGTFSNGVWGAGVATGENALTDVLAWLTLLRNKRFYGPFWLYLSASMETFLDGEFKASSDISIRERLNKIESITHITVADALPTGSAILLQATSNVVKLIYGFLPTAIQWEELGGMRQRFLVMAIMVPLIKADSASNCGIVHVGA
jgi:uncharacterized linocin/CFP29 family protein